MIQLLLSCTTAAEELPTPPAPTLDGEPVAFAEWMGAVPLVAAAPGSYALTLSASSHAFITMERTIWEGVSGTVSLSVAAGGTFTGCIEAARSSGGSVSRFASHDGEDHRSESKDDYHAGFRGTWAQQGDWMTLTLAEAVWNTCDQGAEHFPTSSGSLRCLGLGAGGVMPRSGLACVVDQRTTGSVHRMTLPAGVPDTTPRPPDLHPVAQRWLLLGTPGLTVNYRYEDQHGAVPEVTVE